MMKLYVWEDVLTDWTSGLIVALAPSLEVALETIGKIYPYAEDEVRHIPPTHVVDCDQSVPVSFIVYGGG